MNIIVADNELEACRLTGKEIADVIRAKPDARLGLATGSTPLRTYQYLIEEYQRGALDFSRVSTVNLDEYVGLVPEHPQSYRYFMNENLFHHINILPENTYVALGTGDLEENLRAFHQRITERRTDIQLLGIGVDGHIGFNEPGPCFHDHCYIETLDESTIDANSRFFEHRDEVPRQAITMGCGEILSAKKIVMLVTGVHKAEALRPLLHGNEITPGNQATILKLHSNTTLIIDRLLADLLQVG